MPDDNELTPCPFCKGRVDVNSMLTSRKGLVLFLKCSRCGTTFRVLEDVYNTRPIEDELRAEVERLKAQVNETCKWTLGDDEYSFWETRCGGAVVFEEETPQANGYKYCHYCGKLIEFTALKGGE